MSKRRRGATRTHDAVMTELLRSRPAEAIAVLNETLAEGSPQEVAVALRHVAAAFGGLPLIARRAGINVTQAYRSLSARGNPSFGTVSAVVRAAGYEFTVRRRRAGITSGKQTVTRRP
jgi:probable addiction module antidote protein